jgi:hypothetical protein
MSDFEPALDPKAGSFVGTFGKQGKNQSASGSGSLVGLAHEEPHEP